MTTIHDAIKQNDIGAIRLHILQGDIELHDTTERTPLQFALKIKNDEAATVLINSGADVNARTKYESPPLVMAVINGNIDIAQKLISAGADVEATDIVKNRPIHVAAGHGQIECIRLLRDNGADLTALNFMKENIADAAAERKRPDVAQMISEEFGIARTRKPPMVLSEERLQQQAEALEDFSRRFGPKSPEVETYRRILKH